jgi:hypothetical protein
MEHEGPLPSSQEPAASPYPQPHDMSPHPPTLVILPPPQIYLRLQNIFLYSDFPTKVFCAHIISTIRATCPSHLILLNLVTLIIYGEEYILRTCSLYNFLYPHVTLSLLGLNIFLSILFPYTLNLCSSLNVGN